MQEDNVIATQKIYELILSAKGHYEERRDEINKFYISLLTIIASALPFLDKFLLGGNISLIHDDKILSGVISILGVTLSVSWVRTLKRIYNCLEGIDQLLMNLEKKCNQSFITYLSSYLEQVGSPGRVTKQETLVPYTFFIIFMCSLVYCLIDKKFF